MSWKATHRAKAGVEVMAVKRETGTWMVSMPCTRTSGACFLEDELDALFELIPQMVRIPLDVARGLARSANDHTCISTNSRDSLEAAIAESEQEAK